MKVLVENLQNSSITDLRLGYGIDSTGVKYLTQSVHLSSLKVLELERAECGVEVLNEIASSHFSNSLQSFKLRSTQVDVQLGNKLLREFQSIHQLPKLKTCTLVQLQQAKKLGLFHNSSPPISTTTNQTPPKKQKQTTLHSFIKKK